MFGESLTIRLAPRDLQALDALARRQDVTVGFIVRGLIASELKRQANTKARNCADGRLVARLQRLLAGAMAEARSWQDLHRRLSDLGYELRPSGGGLTVHRLSGDERLCKSSDLGFAYTRLVKRFRAPMPGHPRKMQHVLERLAPEDMEEDFEVIEED
ncbi:relaxase family protein [Nioella nitratireducens]|uniref:hypothetical protein n=1 Tax=Nioella nitratireducens TaxID=1287720 RepID=UPI000A02D30F|nr:hypothetical protein [Nioella nitratireducens]